ncbi:MAG TPA: hypothetical protein VK171_14570 [Fimbriimonas sp.]|nr:hypothetical protein [Fimbriimonas sp.]
MANIWKSAKSFEDLCELGAQWCERKFENSLTYGEPDPETEPLIPILAQMNRAGFFTTFSQPGAGSIESGNAQRAAVHGHASEELARRLYCVGLETGLLVLAYPPGYDSDVQIPVTVDGFQPFCWHGMTDDQSEREGYRNQLTRDAYYSLLTSWQVVLIDTEWGREDLLWKCIAEVLAGKETPFSSEPCDELELETDFVC